MFFEFCQESGYDKILKVLGPTPRDFLQNLDALHDHLATIYPGMRAPSFRCTERDEDGALILHYYSEREGLEHIVIGIVKVRSLAKCVSDIILQAVASILHSTEVDVEIYKRKGEENTDHFQFAITEKKISGTNPFLPPFEGESGKENVNSNPTSKKLARVESIGSNSLTGSDTMFSVQSEMSMMSMQNRISPQTFCHCFPFHLIFDRNLVVRQAGTSVCRVLPALTKPDTLITDVFETVRPHMELTVKNVLSHINTVFVLRTKPTIGGAGDAAATNNGGNGVSPIGTSAKGKRSKPDPTGLLDPALNPAKPPEHSK